jgi:hypothetical protein
MSTENVQRNRKGNSCADVLIATLTFIFITPHLVLAHDGKTLDAGRVILFVLDNVSLSELIEARPKWMLRLATSGGIAALCTRTGGAMKPVNACITVAYGDKAVASEDGELAFNVDEPLEFGRAVSVYERCVGRKLKPDEATVVIPYVEGLKKLNMQIIRRPITPFALGEMLNRHGIKTAVLGCDDTSFEYAPTALYRHSALIASCSSGIVQCGDVSKDMLLPDPKAPFGITANLHALREKLRQCFLSGVRFVVIDIGETFRAHLCSSRMSDEAAKSTKIKAIAKCDEALGMLLSWFNKDRDLLLIFTTVASGKMQNELGFVIAYGKGVKNSSLLTSATTRRVGLVALTDIAPTVAHHFGIELNVIGQRMDSVHAEGNIETVLKLINATSQTDSFVRPLALFLMGILQALNALLLLLWCVSIRSRWASNVHKALILTGSYIMALPLSYLCEMPLRHMVVMPFASLLLAWLIALVLSIGLWTALNDGLRFVAVMSGVSFFAMLVDALAGSRLQLSSILGYSPFYGGRFYGLGNVGMSALLGSSIALSYSLSCMFKKPHSKSLLWLLIGVITTFVVGHPSIGANFGGLLSAFASFAVGYLALRRVKLSTRNIAVALVALALVLVAIVTVDFLRGAHGASHIGRFIIMTREQGFGVLTGMMLTKVSVWGRAFRHVAFTVALSAYVISGVLCALLLKEEMTALLKRNEVMACTMALVFGAFVSLVTNDSGPITPVVMLAYVWTSLSLTLVPSISEKASAQSMV